MAKPVGVPEWASAETNNAEPAGGQKTSGWTTDQIGIGSYDNWWKRRAMLWIAYLDAINDEAFTWSQAQTFSGLITFSTHITANGNLTLAGNLTVNGNTALGNGTGDTATVAGSLTVGTTLGVTGAATVGGTLGVTGAATLGSVAAGAGSFSGAVTLPANNTTIGQNTVNAASLAANWTANVTVNYWKDSAGLVHLEGVPKANASAGNDIFTLPAGFRPPATRYFEVTKFAIGGAISLERTLITVSAAGVVNVQNSSDPPDTFDAFSLDGIYFRT